MTTWLIQYENDHKPSLSVHGDRQKAERLARKRNKYQESFTITEAPKPDRELEKEIAHRDAIRYGCSTNGMN